MKSRLGAMLKLSVDGEQERVDIIFSDFQRPQKTYRHGSEKGRCGQSNFNLPFNVIHKPLRSKVSKVARYNIRHEMFVAQMSATIDLNLSTNFLVT